MLLNHKQYLWDIGASIHARANIVLLVSSAAVPGTWQMTGAIPIVSTEAKYKCTECSNQN